MVKCPATTPRLPPGGKTGRVRTIQPGIYRTALREREDDILPYKGKA